MTPAFNSFRYGAHSRLAYAEFGDSSGHPILVQHGLIASIRDRHLFGRLARWGARLISVARPGYGESSPHALSCLAEWGEVVRILADELHLAQFDVLGISSGAPYSYAIGSRLPDRVRRIFIFSGTPALFDERVLALWPYPVDRNASLDGLKGLAREVFFSDLTDADRQRDDVIDSMRNDCFGVAQGLKLRCADWGFDLASVKANVHMQHGRRDDQVPVKTAEITAGLLPNCRLEIRGQGGHYSAELLDEFIRTTMIGTGGHG